MKHLKKGLILLVSLFFILTGNVQAQENFDITNYDVHMIVHEDGSIRVHETIDLDYSTYVHGFYRNIPIQYRMDFGNGPQTYYFPVSDISVNGDPYEVETESEGVQIRIGDPNKMITGKKSYDISYTIQTRDLNLDQDIFYWNLIGQFDCKINHVDFKIEMPKSFNKSNVEFYTNDLIYSINNNVIYGQTIKPLNNYQSLTIYVELGEHYFIFPIIPDYTFLGIGLCGILLVVLFFLYMKFARQEKAIPVVSFEAPKGLSSAGVGYVIDGVVDNKDVLSLIIDFANRGYLKIHDTKDDTILTKVKKIDRSCNGYEIIFFDALFDGKDEVSCNDLQDQYFGDKIVATKEHISNYFHLKENKVFAGSSLAIQILLCILSGLAGALLSAFKFYAKIGIVEEAIIPIVFVWPLISASMILWIFISRQKHAYSKSKNVMMHFLAILLNCVGLGISFLFLRNDLIAFGFVVIYTFFMTYMIATSGNRTKIGNHWLSEILGLKEFILQAEKDRLEMLVHDDPTYFYHILPYAYVLGISDTWSKKFEKINVASPDWYTSYDGRSFSTIYWMSHFNHTMHHLNSVATSITPPKAGEGGFSSSGGGFSGGGFGGGGGGSW